MGLFRAFDGSVPPAAAPAGVQAVLGYLGGPTPHIWTEAEWLRFSHLRQAGIWIVDFSKGGWGQGDMAASAAKALDWAAHARRRRVIWLDAETTVQLDVMANACEGVAESGYMPGIYGSQSTVVAYERLGHPLWVANWNGMPAVPPLPDVAGHQYAANLAWDGTEIDLDVFDGSMWDHFGDGPRK
jgi:hypothetical protein